MIRQIPADILEAAAQTAALELQVDPDLLRAMHKGIMAALARHEQHVVRKISERAAKLAEELDIDDDDDMALDGPAALLMLAMQLREELPQEADDPYRPAEDDLVELILTGTVILGDPGSGEWSVVTADFSKVDFTARSSQAVLVRLIRRSTG